MGRKAGAPCSWLRSRGRSVRTMGQARAGVGRRIAEGPRRRRGNRYSASGDEHVCHKERSDWTRPLTTAWLALVRRGMCAAGRSSGDIEDREASMHKHRRMITIFNGEKYFCKTVDHPFIAGCDSPNARALSLPNLPSWSLERPRKSGSVSSAL